MEKNFSRENYWYEIVTEKRENSIFSVARLRCFVKPDTNSKSNVSVIDDVNKRVDEFVKFYVDMSDILSYNYIADFECTRENLNPGKWSRLKVDLYLMTEFTEIEDELFQETCVMCEKLGLLIEKCVTENGFLICSASTAVP